MQKTTVSEILLKECCWAAELREQANENTERIFGRADKRRFESGGIECTKRKTGPTKVKIRPVEVRGGIFYQASAQDGPKVFHKNYSREELLEYLEKSLKNEFGQLQASGQNLDGTVLVSKKGKITIRTKMHQTQEPVKILSHNRVKQYILKLSLIHI